MTGSCPLSPVKPLVVKVESAFPKVTLPLLLTNSELNVVPKKSTGNGRLTAPVELSSFAGSGFVANPGSCRMVPLPVKCATVGLNGELEATDTSAVRGPGALGVNVVLTGQVPGPETVPQSALWPKSPGKLPVSVTPLI